MISVIIPVLNEADNIGRCIEAIHGENRDIEIIIADGGSGDNTVAIATGYPSVAVVYSGSGRGIQMNTGASAAAGDVLLFLHADTLLEKGWSQNICESLEGTSTVGGAFTFTINNPLWKYRLVEAWVKLRCSLCSLPFGDQAIFVRKSAFDLIGGYKKIPLMEDVDFISRLKGLGSIVILDKKAITSERRWLQKGLITTAVINQLIMLLYRSGVNPRLLARIYYR